MFAISSQTYLVGMDSTAIYVSVNSRDNLQKKKLVSRICKN